MVAAAFALINWIPRFAQTASEPLTLAIWGGALIILGALLRGWYARRSTPKAIEPPRLGSVERRLPSRVAQPVEG